MLEYQQLVWLSLKEPFAGEKRDIEVTLPSSRLPSPRGTGEMRARLEMQKGRRRASADSVSKCSTSKQRRVR
jgi:hypothetical protein